MAMMGTMAVTVENETHGVSLRISGYISTDLPAERMGEIMADAMQEAWKRGADPVHCKIEVKFS